MTAVDVLHVSDQRGHARSFGLAPRLLFNEDMKRVIVFGLVASVLFGSVGCWGRHGRTVDVRVEERRGEPRREERRDQRHEQREERHEEHH